MAEKRPNKVEASVNDRDTSLNEQNEELDIGNTRHPKHGHMLWTACYDDDCHMHRSEKDRLGWYPKKPRMAKLAVRQANVHQAQIPVERDLEIIQCRREGPIYKTWYWKQVHTIEEVAVYGANLTSLIHYPEGPRQT
ncbi:hypothetical protein LTR70_009984, partial [Exophiala xenobiotica]